MSFVLEIIGFFLFVGGFMYLVLSGRLADMFRDREPKPLLLIALITGCALYHWTTILSEPTSAPVRASTVPSTEVPAPPKPAPVVGRRKARAVTSTQAPEPPGSEPEHWETIIVQEATPKQALVPPATDPVPTRAPARPGPDPYESKAKRGIKAVGRFLHLRKTEQ